MLAASDAERLGLERGQNTVVRHAAGTHAGPLRISHRLRPGCVRINWRGAASTGTSADVGAA
jgi:hypothetical protein